MAGNYDFRHDPVLRAFGPLMERTARAYMGGDEFGAELFDLWLSGKAPEHVVLDNPRWTAYMAADKGLSDQIDAHLMQLAQKLRDGLSWRSPIPPMAPPLEVQKSPPVARCGSSIGPLAAPLQSFKTSFHAEVGSETGGYRTGYAQLHGSNRDAGDFEIEGTVQMGRVGSKLEFTFRNNQMTFNDIVDPNFKWRSDVAFATLARNIKAATGGLPPKNFRLHIRWREAGPWTYALPAVQ